MNRPLLSLVVLLSFAGSGFAQHSTTDSAQHSAHGSDASQSKPSPDALWDGLLTGNKRFVAGKPQTHPLVSLRRKLASGQSPNVIVLSCSDSRVSPELIFDQSLGDLFVVRTAGNIADPVALGSMEYAVAHFHSPVLLVLGHQKCGAVIAACSGDKMPSTNLDAIVEKINPAVTQAKTYAHGDDLVESAIKENIHQSARDVLANSAILSEAVKSGKIKVIEAEYQLDTGEVVLLNSSARGRN
jgi:carbonic anhydrase